MTFEDLPEALTSQSDFPRAVSTALATLAAARVAADDADRTERRTSQAVHAEEEEERRLLTTEGDLPLPNAADERTARMAVATRDLRAAERNLARAERDANAASTEHATKIQTLAKRVAIQAHADVVEHGDRYLAALEIRERAYEIADRPGLEEYAPGDRVPDRRSEVYWPFAPEDTTRVTVYESSTSGGLPRVFPTLTDVIARTRSVIDRFPLAAKAASA